MPLDVQSDNSTTPAVSDSSRVQIGRRMTGSQGVKGSNPFRSTEGCSRSFGASVRLLASASRLLEMALLLLTLSLYNETRPRPNRRTF